MQGKNDTIKKTPSWVSTTICALNLQSTTKDTQHQEERKKKSVNPFSESIEVTFCCCCWCCRCCFTSTLFTIASIIHSHTQCKCIFCIDVFSSPSSSLTTRHKRVSSRESPKKRMYCFSEEQQNQQQNQQQKYTQKCQGNPIWIWMKWSVVHVIITPQLSGILQWWCSLSVVTLSVVVVCLIRRNCENNIGEYCERPYVCERECEKKIVTTATTTKMARGIYQTETIRSHWFRPIRWWCFDRCSC